jgi:hypothetical protein
MYDTKGKPLRSIFHPLVSHLYALFDDEFDLLDYRNFQPLVSVGFTSDSRD